MASYEAFVEILKELTDFVLKENPENERVISYKEKLDKASSENYEAFVTSFMHDMNKYGECVTNKDEKFFNTEAHIVKRTSLHKLWSNFDDEQKEKIWEYLNTLYVFGTTLRSVPKDVLKNIEAMAAQIANESTSNSENAEDIDINSLLNGMKNLIK